MADVSSTTKKEVARVRKAVDYILKKLDVKYTVGIYPMIDKHGEERTADEEINLIEVCRSDRGQQDKNTFLLFLNTDELAKMPLNRVKRHVFHEICHIITWEYTDEMENMIKHIPDGLLKEELVDRWYNIREDITYRMERAYGPHVLPQIDWTEL